VHLQRLAALAAAVVLGRASDELADAAVLINDAAGGVVELAGERFDRAEADARGPLRDREGAQLDVAAATVEDLGAEVPGAFTEPGAVDLADRVKLAALAELEEFDLPDDAVVVDVDSNLGGLNGSVLGRRNRPRVDPAARALRGGGGGAARPEPRRLSLPA
jgi:hypothetical protein